MTSKNFYIHEGLTVGGLTIDALTGNIVTTGTITAVNITGSITTATNLTGGSAGRIPYQSAPGATAFATAGTTGQLLSSVGSTPTFVNTGSVMVAAANSAITADLATLANNATTATNLAGGSAGSVPYQTGVGSTTLLAIGNSGQILQVGQTNLPTWVDITTLVVGNSTSATNIANGSAGQLIFQSASGVTGFVGPGTADQILVSAGSTSTGPLYVNTAAIQVGFATNVLGGAAGQLPYQSASGATAFLSLATTGQVLTAGASAPTYVSTATLRVGYATNVSGGSAGQLPYQSASGATGFVGPGTSGQLLVSAGSTSTGPVYTNTSSIQVGFATNLLGGSLGQLPYQSASGSTGFVGPGTAGQLLVSQGASTPLYTNTSSVQVGSAANILGGLAGQLPYQSASGTTGFVSTGTVGQLLVSQGTAAPSYVNTASINVGNAAVAATAQLATCATNLAGGTAGQIACQSGLNSTGFVNTGSLNVGNAVNAVAGQVSTCATNLEVGTSGLTN